MYYLTYLVNNKAKGKQNDPVGPTDHTKEEEKKKKRKKISQRKKQFSTPSSSQKRNKLWSSYLYKDPMT